MHFHNSGFMRSLYYAFSGIGQALKYEAHLRIHLICAGLAIFAGIYYRLTETEWLILVLTIALVIFAELVNTAVEANVDLVTKAKKAEAKIAKDVAAGAVLVTSLNALIVGFILFSSKILK
jgi:diacylglycerol kinase